MLEANYYYYIHFLGANIKARYSAVRVTPNNTMPAVFPAVIIRSFVVGSSLVFSASCEV